MPTGIIMAYSIPDGAQVLIDGTMMFTTFGAARTPAIIPEIPAGMRTVTFMLPGYVNFTKTVEVPQGGYATVYGILYPIAK